MQLPLACLPVQPVANPSMYPKNTQRMLTGPGTQSVTGKVLCSTAPACRTHTKHKHRQSRPLLPFQLLETVKVHTCDALWDHKHTHIHGSSEYRHFLHFSVTCLGHTVTLHLCISHVKVQNHIMANSSILRLQQERAYVEDCLKAGL